MPSQLYATAGHGPTDAWGSSALRIAAENQEENPQISSRYEPGKLNRPWEGDASVPKVSRWLSGCLQQDPK